MKKAFAAGIVAGLLCIYVQLLLWTQVPVTWPVREVPPAGAESRGPQIFGSVDSNMDSITTATIDVSNMGNITATTIDVGVITEASIEAAFRPKNQSWRNQERVNEEWKYMRDVPTGVIMFVGDGGRVVTHSDIDVSHDGRTWYHLLGVTCREALTTLTIGGHR